MENPDAKDLLARRRELLARMERMGVSFAAEHFARAEQEHPPGANPVERPLDRLFPHAERLAGERGGVCCRLRVEAPLTGERSREGYMCPVDPMGGPPDPRVLADLTGDARWADVDPGRIVYFDTETTSLATGSGTYTFLIGLGRFEGSSFVVEQYFMEDYSEEAALVEAADRALERAQALVSYNGIAFDLPLLEVRWRLQRRKPRFPDLHLDLLTPARRLWKLRLADCSLGTVEGEILGIRRMSDVDGSWVPRIYFDFVRGVRVERMAPVFDHHAQDIFSLGALAALVAHAWTHPGDERFAHASDQWGLARILEARGRREAALERMEAAVLAARDEELAFRMAMHLARTYKRLGRFDDAVGIWQARAAQARPGRLDPLVELAKHAEHRLKDIDAARRWVERALSILQTHAELKWLTGSNRAGSDMRGPDAADANLSGGLASNSAPVSPHDLDALNHRLARLTRKQHRAR